MSELAKTARKAMKDKAKSLAGGRSGPVDASGYVVPDEMNADIKTGMRPISRRQFKRGGKVLSAEGENARKNAGKKPRKAAGGALATPNNLINRNDRDANQERSGKKHVGGFASGGKASSCDDRDFDDSEAGMKRGGRTKKMDGGSFVPTGRMSFTPSDSRMARATGLKSGGRAKREDGGAAPAAAVAGKGGGGKGLGGYLKKAAPYLIGGLLGSQLFRKEGGRVKRTGGGQTVIDKPRSGGQTIDTTSKAFRDALAARNAASGNSSSQSPEYRKGLGTDREIVERANRTPVERMPEKRGGKVNKWEGSKKDESQDKKLAKKYGMSMSEWEKSTKDKKHDKQRSTEGLKKGGRAKREVGGALLNIPNQAPSSGGSLQTPGNAPGAPRAGVTNLNETLGAAKSAIDIGKDVAKLFKKDGGRALDGEIQGTRPTGGRLARKSGGRTGKGKVNVNIVIATKGGAQDGMMPPGAPIKPAGMPIPVGLPPAGGLPAGSPPPMPAAPPPAMMPAGGPPPGMPMGRKSGGRVYRSYKDMDAGAGSGEGRLEKAEIQKRKK